MNRIEMAVIMVTDLVGSTALRSRLGNALFDRLRQEHDSILRDAAENVGGSVVKNTGDGLLVAFPSVIGALDGAVAMQQKLDRRNRSADVAVGVRIGISIGDASVEDGDYFGIPPIEASRLCAKAQGSEILVTDPLRTVLRDPGPHELESVGALELKGLPAPVLAWRVLWTPLPESAGPPLPPRLRGVPETAYVGRPSERGVVLDCWDRAVAGERQVVVIAGEPGIGKTRLVTQTAQALPDDALILYGRCDEDQGIPYHPWREVLRDYVEVAPRRLLRPFASELSRLVPGVSEKLGGELAAPAATDPATERYLVFHAVRSLLAAAAERAPVLVILDDLHWADRASLMLLKHLVTASTTGRLMLFGTFRDTDIAADHPLTALLADLHREPGVTRLGLTGLDESEIADLMAQMAGHPIDSAGRALASEIHHETAGNPFFVGELLRHLRETGTIATQPDGRWSFRSSLAGRGLPQGVREVIERRVARLSEETREVLTVGAVIGGDFDLVLAARAAARPTPLVLDLLDEAMSASLLTKTAITRGPSFTGPALTEIYTFSHGLVQATLYDALPAGRRAALHHAVGEAIEAMSPDGDEDRLAELAHHFLAAAPAVEPARAVDYARRAGERAMTQFSYEQAAELFARALELTGAGPGRARIDLLQSLGDAQMRAGDAAAARRTLLRAANAASRLGDPEALVRATRSRGLWGLNRGVDTVLVGLAEEAIERLEEWGRPRLTAEIKGLLAAALYYAPASEAERRERLAAEALATAREVHAQDGDRASTETLAYVLSRYLLARWSPESAVRDFPLADELSALCRELGDVDLELLACNWRTTMLLERGEFAALDREVARIEYLATELRQPRAMVFLPLHRGMLAGTAGRFDEAERLNAESREIGRRIAGSVSRLAGDSQMMLIRLQQGRLPELEDQVRHMVETKPEIVSIRCAFIVLLLQAGRPADARTEFERVIGPGLAALPRNHAQILTLALLAEAAAELGDVPRARSLYEWLSPYRGRWVAVASTSALWPVERSLGRLAGVGGAVELALSHLAAARAQAQQADALPSLAQIDLDEARLRVARGSPGDAEAAALSAAQARLLGDALGMRRVAAEAARLAAEPPEPWTAAVTEPSGAVGTLE